MTLDITRDEAVTVLEALGAAADVVVASPTRRTPVAGFDRDEGHLQWAAPGAIVASITPFGLVGPMRDLRTTPFVSFAMGGGMHWTGHRDGPPLAAPGQLAWDEAGIHAAFGIVSALFGHGRFGGQTLDFAVHDLAASKDFLIERFDVGAINDWGRSVEIGIPPSGRGNAATASWASLRISVTIGRRSSPCWTIPTSCRNRRWPIRSCAGRSSTACRR